MKPIAFYQDEFSQHLEEFNSFSEPKNLYQPISYILSLGGKRLRPVLTLMTTDIFGGNFKDALNAALCVEVFHNFSLIHDDIMDDAPLRRGQVTVHEKWDLNTGILSGDAMLILSYRLLESYENEQFKSLMTLFSETALQVCEGQQYDVDFETRNDVIVDQYIRMIAYKTAVLVAAAMKMGAIIAKTTPQNQNSIYEYGYNLGIAFQLQDDYLDAFGDTETFGKQIGGDIIENKKTYLYLKALELGSKNDKKVLLELFNSESNTSEEKINTVKEIFETSGAVIQTKAAIESYTKKAFSVLENLAISDEKKMGLRHFGEQLMQRKV
ncbi:polyprenyl synthetase family protein [Paucihalobacter sp.]|uniref:polyprenyl synthetase family protein n=1 Tax=Paucihalobacter sp. TaxID=2850405 RepID=UPI003D16134A